jgi:uncharacterized damage-inducible protein DinB
MIDALLLMYDRNLDYAKRLTADIADDKFAAEPPGAKAPLNHAAWVIGHLAHVCDFYGGALGATGGPTMPKDWGTLFGGSSKPEPGGNYPPKAVLLKALEDGHARIKQLALQKPAEFWSQPPADEKRRARFPTNAAMAVHIIVNHEAVHLGQLSAWRRAQGLPAV